jgi:hypothetical protein
MKNVKKVSANRQLVKNNFSTILFIILLVAISLFLGLLPTLSFGQNSFMLSSPTPASEVPSSFSPDSPPTPNSSPVLPDSSSSSSSPSLTSDLPPIPLQRPPQSPTPIKIQATELSSESSSPAPPKPPTQLLSNRSENLRSENLRSVVDSKHPFARFFELPKESQSAIKGQAYTVAQLLENTQTPLSRGQLLQTYWELAGLLAEYNIRYEAERLSGMVRDELQNSTTVLFQQQRRSVEMEFIKKQWQLAGLLRRFKGISIAEKELPIPCDYPLFKRYETFADKIARTARSQYLGHLIPVQEQLIDARHQSCTIIFEMRQNNPTDSREIMDMLNRRTTAFLELVEAVIDYNKMIAEYASETIPADISGSRLVGALIELPQTYSPKDSATPNPLPLNSRTFNPLPIIPASY